MTNDNGTITFSLTFSALSSPLTVSHLHFAPKRSQGSDDLPLWRRGPAGLPGGDRRNDHGDDHIGKCDRAHDQGIGVGDLDAALEAIRLGLSYVNVHTTNFAAGEVRGQVRKGSREAAVVE